MSVEIKLGDIGFNHPGPTREWLEDAADREDECGGIVTAGSMEPPRDCLDCGTCHDCIIRTMEAAHQAELAALAKDADEMRKRYEVAVEALRPFSESAEAKLYDKPDEQNIRIGNYPTSAKVGDFRRAAAVVAEHDAKPKEQPCQK